LYKSTFKELLSKFLSIYEEADLKDKAIKDFNKNLQITLKNLSIDPDMVEREILEFKNNSNDQQIVSDHENDIDNFSNDEHLNAMNNQIQSPSNNLDDKSVKSNDSVKNINKSSSYPTKSIDPKFNKPSQCDIKAKNIKQIEFKLRSDKRVNERIKSVDKNYERQRDL